MAQQNFLVDDEPRHVLTAKAGTAITAGQLLYASGATAEPFGTTVSGGYSWDYIEVKNVHEGTATQGQYFCGMALHDAANGSQVAVVTEGLVLSPAEGGTNITAGMFVRPAYNETTAGVAKWAETGTTTKADNEKALGQIAGRALTGAETEGHYVLWKMRV